MKLGLCLLITCSIFILRISCGDVKPIIVDDVFNPKEGQCTHDAKAMEKFFQGVSKTEPKVGKALENKIKSNVNNFVKENNKDAASSFIANHIAKDGGEVASWVTALVTASFGIAGVLSEASSILGVVSPGVGLISWVAGIYSSHQDKKEKKKLLQNIQNNFELMNTKMNVQFQAMKDYVDDSIISSDHERLGSELNQMNLYLSDCLLIEDKDTKERCLEDRCSYVKSGFKKFALFADQLLAVDPTTRVDENGKVKKLSEIEAVNRANAKKILAAMNSQDVKRVFANIKTFNTYVSTVLLRCETYRVIKKQYPALTVKSKADNKQVNDIFDFLNPNENEWNLKDRVLNYLENSYWVLYESYMSTKPVVVADGFDRDESKSKTKIRRKSKRKVQCRFKMNDFGDICDKEYETEKTALTDDQATQMCQTSMEEEKEDFVKSVQLESIIAYMDFFKMKNMLVNLYRGPKEKGTEIW